MLVFGVNVPIEPNKFRSWVKPLIVVKINQAFLACSSSGQFLLIQVENLKPLQKGLKGLGLNNLLLNMGSNPLHATNGVVVQRPFMVEHRVSSLGG